MIPVRSVFAAIPMALMGAIAVAQAMPQPVARPDSVVAAAKPATDASETRGSDAGLQDWIGGFRTRALEQGISPATFDAAMGDLSYDPLVIERDRNQSEFTKALWDYLDTAVSDLRVQNGRAALAAQRDTLEAIEDRYGVDKEVVAAIWGLESAYGTFRGSDNVLRSLATLAYDARRGKFFEGQLIDALRILQDGDTTPARMTGSWAGAMGHTQFMPSSYLAYAVDFTGDGRREIWGDDPADALASTAAYLKNFGWMLDQPWGVEVRLPEDFDYELANRAITRTPAEWADIGVNGLNGQPVPHDWPAAILLPAGAQGAAFMIFHNFEVIERYNTADAYVIGVGHLADRIAGGGPIKASWPRDDRTLSFDERVELQERLTAAGHDTQGADGLIGPLTIDGIRSYQRSAGLIPDGYASLRLLERLR